MHLASIASDGLVSHAVLLLEMIILLLKAAAMQAQLHRVYLTCHISTGPCNTAKGDGLADALEACAALQGV